MFKGQDYTRKVRYLTDEEKKQASIDDFQQGFDEMRSGRSGKVILNWD
jgi:hypothetical protein